VAEPHLDLLDVLAGREEQRRAGVPERVEGDPRHAGAFGGGVEDVAPALRRQIEREVRGLRPE
jgi:hypothetical protein